MMTLPESDPVTAWATDVDAGKIVAGPHIRAAAKRHLTDLEEGPKRGLFWDVRKANRALEFFPKHLRLNGGQFEGLPFNLHPSQMFRVGSLFGWFDKTEKRRRFRRFYDEEGKGNGKSPMLAGIGLYGLVADSEPSAEIYAAASKKDQAMILFRDAVAMREQSPELAKRIHTHGIDPVWQLSYRGRLGRSDKRFFKPISADDGKSGPRPHMALCDEVHEHKSRDVIDMLERGFKFRRNPLLAMATNAGTDRGSICFEEHTHAISVASGMVEDDTTFAFVCSLDEDDDWEKDPTCWPKANPLLGSILTTDYLALQVAQAKAIPGKRNGIARLHFCEWTDAENAAFSKDAWMSCNADLDWRDLVEAGYPCYGGLDLSRTRDFTAFTLTWVLDDTKDEWVFASHTWFWTPAETLAMRSAKDKQPYEVWERDGHIESVNGNRISYRWVAEALAEINAEAHPVAIGGDEYGLQQLSDQLIEIGADLPITVHPQGFQRRVIEKQEGFEMEGQEDVFLWMPDSINKLEAAVYDKRIRLSRNPMMNSCAAGVVYSENRTGHRMFDKSKAHTRIDGMVSLAMSIGVATCRDKAVQDTSTPWDQDPDYRMVG